MGMPKPLILFIDAYDSFSNNIISLLETTLDVSVRTVKIDNPVLLSSDDALRKELSCYAAVVCGPGPGDPRNQKDIGIIDKIWQLRGENVLPVLGICLGFQSLCLAFGGEVKRLKGPQHGIIRRVRHIGEAEKDGSIFDGVGEIHATLYQSLCAQIGHDGLTRSDWRMTKWESLREAPMLKPLAWVEHDGSEERDSGIQDPWVLVAVQHKKYPFWGLQYHPESICTNEESKIIISNWFSQAQTWNRVNRSIDRAHPVHGQCSVRQSLLSRAKGVSSSTPQSNVDKLPSRLICHYRRVSLLSKPNVSDIVDTLQDTNDEKVILESTNCYANTSGTADVRGRYSIIGLDLKNCMRVNYTCGSNYITKIAPRGISQIPITFAGGIWPFIASQLNDEEVVDGPAGSPFWGGFMGYTSYELGLESIAVRSKTNTSPSRRPDLSFVWITSSLIIDHRTNVIYLQELAPKMFAEHVEKKFDMLSWKLRKDYYTQAPEVVSFASAVISLAEHTNRSYEEKVQACQDKIKSGDAYELCLTSQTQLSLSRTSSWSMYKTLRTRQLAPFASYIRIGPATFMSASPERFVKWDQDGNCELRPMKGTVRKSADVFTLAQAIKILDVPKEKAENLMIVDLVRHDLHGICGSGNVSVPRLLVVEEYTSVFQMISVVQGRILPPVEGDNAHNRSKAEGRSSICQRYTGLDVLAASLPPGSMTGAPKKRSCEILCDIEKCERSLYSGVVGYVDVRGRGDWSVNIRCMYNWDDEVDDSWQHNDFGGYKNNKDRFTKAQDPVVEEKDLREFKNGRMAEIWHIGAGGAVTALSTPTGEREEMQTKLESILAMFRE